MDPNSSISDHALLEELRRHRAELRESMSAPEGALAAPAAADQARWAQRVHVALVELSGDFVRTSTSPRGPTDCNRRRSTSRGHVLPRLLTRRPRSSTPAR